MSITIRQMLVFDAVARLGSVSGAAESIGLTQSAASMALKEMEQRLGAQLFLRDGKPMKLSDLGRRLHPKVRAVLCGVAEIEHAVGTSGQRLVLALGASATLGEVYLPPIIAELFAKEHGIHIELSIFSTQEVIERVEDLRLELGFIDFPSIRPALHNERWSADELAVFCAPSHHLAGRQQVDLSILGQERWCLEPRRSVSRTFLTRALLNHADTVDVVFESNSAQAIKRVVEAEVGIGCLPHAAIRRELAEGSVVQLPAAGLELRHAYSVIWRRDAQLTPAHQALVALVLAQAVG